MTIRPGCPGGLQIKAYGAAPDATTAPLARRRTRRVPRSARPTGETITWTQRLSLSAGSLSFNVVNGQSTTWGQFGQGQGNLGLSVSSTLADLGGYKPDYSIVEVGRELAIESGRLHDPRCGFGITAGAS